GSAYPTLVARWRDRPRAPVGPCHRPAETSSPAPATVPQGRRTPLPLNRQGSGRPVPGSGRPCPAFLLSAFYFLLFPKRGFGRPCSAILHSAFYILHSPWGRIGVASGSHWGGSGVAMRCL